MSVAISSCQAGGVGTGVTGKGDDYPFKDAEIDVPDLQHQMDQANSQATLAQKSLEQAKSTNTKWQQLFHEGVVSELDSENMATSQATNQCAIRRKRGHQNARASG